MVRIHMAVFPRSSSLSGSGFGCRLRLLLLGLIAALISFAGAQEAGVFEKWTALDGREMSAQLLRSTDGEAEFLLRNGKRAKVALDRLVESDRLRVAEFRRAGKYWKTPPKHAQWPERVSLNWLESKVEVIEAIETDEVSKHVYRTRHFEFEADAKLAPNLVQDFCKIFEVTHAALEQNPLGLQLYRPESGYFKVRLFKDTMGYHRAGGLLNAAGVYNGASKQILVPFRSLGLRKANVAWVRRGKVYDPTTLIHEVTHQLLDHWLEVAPIWFNEGIADLVGAARYDSGQLFFDRLENGMKERILGKERTNRRVRFRGASGFELPLDPKDVLQASRAQFMGYPPARRLEHSQVVHHYHTSLLLVHFALNDGKEGPGGLRQYLETYRQDVTRRGINELEFPDKIATDEDRELAQQLLIRRMMGERAGMDAALPKLTRGRSDEVFFDDMAGFYRSKGIFLKPAG